MNHVFEQLLSIDDDAVRAFVEHTRERATQYGVGFVFCAEPQLPYPTALDLPVSGYFIDRPRLELGVATGKEIADWLPILVHESCHMDQWIEKSIAWKEAFCEERETVDWLDDWVGGREDLPLPIAELARRSREVELDCERRSVAKIQAFGLPIDVEEYARRANAYVFFYNHILITRQWYGSGQAPYQRDDVWSAAPSQFTQDGLTPPSLSEAFHRAYGPHPESAPRSPGL